MRNAFNPRVVLKNVAKCDFELVPLEKIHNCIAAALWYMDVEDRPRIDTVILSFKLGDRPRGNRRPANCVGKACAGRAVATALNTADRLWNKLSLRARHLRQKAAAERRMGAR